MNTKYSRQVAVPAELGVGPLMRNLHHDDLVRGAQTSNGLRRFDFWQNQSSVGLIWSPETLPNGFEYQKQGSTVGASDDNWHSYVEFGRGCRP